MAALIHTLVLYQGHSDERSTMGLVFTHSQGFSTVQAALMSIRAAYNESVAKDQSAIKLDDCCTRTLKTMAEARFCSGCGQSVVPTIPTAGEKFAEHLYSRRGDQYPLEATLLDAGWEMDLTVFMVPNWKCLVAVEAAEEHLDNCAHWDYRRYVDAGEDDPSARTCMESVVILDVICHDENLIQPQCIFNPY